MKKLIIIPFLFISIFGFNQNIDFQYGYNIVFDTVNQDTITSHNYKYITIPTRDYYWVLETTTLVDSLGDYIYIEGSVSGDKWKVISDSLIIPTEDETGYFISGTTLNYPLIRFVLATDRSESTNRNFPRTIFYVRKMD